MLSKRQLDNLSPELKPYLKYGIVIDAGSSGSRIQIYSWIDTNFLMEKIQSGEGDKYQDFITSDGLPIIKQGSSNDNFDAQLKIDTEGISAYAGHAKDIGPNHIKILMDYAMSFIPSDKYADTEVYLFATAGMRLLTDIQQKEILDEIYNYTKNNYQFKLKNRETNIRVISGEEEGLFGWISTNYLQHGFSVDEGTNERQTYNFVDMGGASTQIAFELNKKIKIDGKSIDALQNAKKNKSDKNIIKLNINNLYGDSLDFNIFVITFLQYGVNETRRRYLEAFLDKKRKDENYQALLKAYNSNTQEEKREEKNDGDAIPKALIESNKNTAEMDENIEPKEAPQNDDTINSSPIKKPSISVNIASSTDEKDKLIWEDPCLPINGRQDLIKPLDYVNMFGGKEGKFIEENVIIKGTGQYDECVKDVYPLLNSTIPCTSDSCLFNNIYSPYTDFNDGKFVAIGKYWDVTNVYHQAGLYDYDDFQKSSIDFCKTDWSVHLNDYNTGKYPDLRRPYDLALNCFRSAYLENIIHQGYKIPKEDNEAIPLTTIAYINGTEASWALGALINQISGTIGSYDPNATSAVNSKSIAANFISTSHNLSISAVSIIAVAAVILFRQRKNNSNKYKDSLEEVPLTNIHTENIDDQTDSVLDIDQELEGLSVPSQYDTEILEDDDNIDIAIDNAITDHENDKSNRDTEQLLSLN
ncbi:nucleoside phosphatase GDA1/CD39 [Piromyces finnis]|uniref:Nucleoside phosphatase GDA1/CD39 n=1 Tax=Piromyces finnis TaxID=1754191 RepID=A0A1Y1VCU2_9FUNG|nr:nucleoside phosphatase GDA1/CD39 [Piromyces finnis]|eukprot:ORX52899.1 nucleoside phosphatase GDA1/CD39 [Piromyces finnis]